jgi:hypothetical protein
MVLPQGLIYDDGKDGNPASNNHLKRYRGRWFRRGLGESPSRGRDAYSG